VGREETFGSGGALEFVEERPVFGRVGVGKVSDGKPIHLLALQSIFLIVIYDLIVTPIKSHFLPFSHSSAEKLDN